MSGGSSTNNSWTILTPEETAAETLQPLAEGTEHHEEHCTSTAEPGHGASTQSDQGAASAEELPVEHPVSEEKKEELNEDSSTDHHTSVPSSVTDAPIPSSLEVPSSSVPDAEALSQSEATADDPAQSSPHLNSFSDAHSRVTPSPDEPPVSQLSTETLGGVEVTQPEKGPTEQGAPDLLKGEGLQTEGEESDLSSWRTDLGKQADFPEESERVEEERAKTTEEEGDPDVKRRSLLAALERIGRTEEEEEGEEEFQLPQREEESVFSLNKCILGAVILLGLGTIFFSGVFMDLDEESDYGTRELKDSEVPGKQEWLNPEVPPRPVDVDSSDILDNLAKGNQQISVLQAQLQAQKDELKVAKGQAAEGAMERLRLEEENTKDAVSSPVESTTLPPSGQQEDSKQGSVGSAEKQSSKRQEEQRFDKMKEWRKDKHDEGEKKEWKESKKSEWKEPEKRERKDGGRTEWKEKKTWKQEKGKFDKVKDREGKVKSHGDDKKWKEWTKEKVSRGDEGKPWKDREGKKEHTDKSERKEWKENKEWKKEKYEKLNEGTHWRDKEEKDRKDRRGGKDHGEKVKEKREGEKEFKKVKDGKEKWDKKDWKEKGEKKEWKKDFGKEGKGKGERRQWEKKEEEWKRKEKKDKSSFQKYQDEHHHHEEHVWGERKPPHTHRSSVDQPEYWTQQRGRLQHKPKPPQHCDSVESCAQAEGLLPVPLPEFEAILNAYLAKAEEVGVDSSKREELQKLTTEFFRDGVFVHNQMSFQDFVEDMGDILEDLVEGDEEEEDSAIEDEMEGFEKEVMEKFSVLGAGERKERVKGEWKKESGRGRG
ncbi:pre-B-cell leukemia homeobox interacting protein 1b isoform 2-T2 [Aulostomus maculatus]